MLGVYWDKESIDSLTSTNKDKDSKIPTSSNILTPLLLFLRPDLVESLKPKGSTTVSHVEGVKVDKSLYSMPKEEYLKFVGGFYSPAKTNVGNSNG